LINNKLVKIFRHRIISGATLGLYQRPTDLSLSYQLGKGANGKNINLGFTSWLGWNVTTTAGYIGPTLYAGAGNINVNLAVTHNDDVPEPGALLVFVTALVSLRVIRGTSRKACALPFHPTYPFLDVTPLRLTRARL